jgi:hypothetical protein
MKNVYIIALKKGNEPYLAKIRTLENMAFIGQQFEKAYICETKAQAEKMRKEWQKIREERKDNEKYPEFYSLY